MDLLLETLQSAIPDKIKLGSCLPDLWSAKVHPEEEKLVANVALKRRLQFRGGRHSARVALSKIGHSGESILIGGNGQPLWASNVVGSISHCDDYAVAACAWKAECVAIGIDCEIASSVSPDIFNLIFTNSELERFKELAPVAPAVAFSAKESIYKCMFSIFGKYIDFQDVEVDLDMFCQRFSFCFSPGKDLKLDESLNFYGWYVFQGDHVVTLCIVE